MSLQTKRHCSSVGGGAYLRAWSIDNSTAWAQNRRVDRDSNSEIARPSPEALLKAAAQEGRGRLKVFLGAAPGVGKTYEMLSEGGARKKSGIDVVIGVV